MGSSLTLKGNLGTKEPINYLNVILSRNLFAGLVELLAFIAPVIGGGKDLGGSGS